uniref:Uncharacterized protein n=1 Tax=Heterorhabditis bacteriophora TaxID=37862 RepID=A0A1I7X7G6_HETBA
MATTLQNIIKVQPRNNHQQIEIDARNNLTSGKMSTESSKKFTESLCTERTGMSGHDFLQKLPRTINACPFLEHGCQNSMIRQKLVSLDNKQIL